MQKTDFQDLEEIPENVASSAKMLASNTAHLARLLKSQPYPGVPKTNQGEEQ